MILLARFETLLHQTFGSVEFWMTRRRYESVRPLRMVAVLMLTAGWCSLPSSKPSALRLLNSTCTENRILQRICDDQTSYIHTRKTSQTLPRQYSRCRRDAVVALTPLQLSLLVKDQGFRTLFIATDARENDEDFFNAFNSFPVPVVRYPGGIDIRNGIAAQSALVEGQVGNITHRSLIGN